MEKVDLISKNFPKTAETCFISVKMSPILADMEYNFYKIDTLNQGTPYDYNSVMQYER